MPPRWSLERGYRGLAIATTVWSVLVASLASGQVDPEAPASLQPRSLVTLHESARLYRLTPGFLPPDGLLFMGAGARIYATTYEVDGLLMQIDLQDFFFGLEYGITPALHLLTEIPYRRWSGGGGEIPATGSGLGDGTASLILGLPAWANWLGWSLKAGSSLPTGDAALGLTEGGWSPHALLALSFRTWMESQLPEMRVHFNAGYRWNVAEQTGYGFDLSHGFQPWPPRYPPSVPGEKSKNDFLLLGAALEFRRGDTSLFIEYSVAQLLWSDVVSSIEYQRFLTAGLRWGRVESWALSLAYDISLAREDYGTAFTAAYPDLVTSLAVSHQFSLGGRDSDGDGIPDRKDQCPDAPEDRDGFEDEDGCPDFDNDGDGIPDYQDGAPLRVEDFDGFADSDGVPDPDNDGDGILDQDDACPDEAENFDGHRDMDGCPDVFSDTDGDGIEDAEDRCPERPEDLDGFEDGDGCPELDNDLDGIDDLQDKCPDQPEDYDGIEDDDGCPEEPQGR